MAPVVVGGGSRLGKEAKGLRWPRVVVAGVRGGRRAAERRQTGGRNTNWAEAAGRRRGAWGRVGRFQAELRRWSGRGLREEAVGGRSLAVGWLNWRRRGEEGGRSLEKRRKGCPLLGGAWGRVRRPLAALRRPLGRGLKEEGVGGVSGGGWWLKRRQQRDEGGVVAGDRIWRKAFGHLVARVVELDGGRGLGAWWPAWWWKRGEGRESVWRSVVQKLKWLQGGLLI